MKLRIYTAYFLMAAITIGVIWAAYRISVDEKQQEIVQPTPQTQLDSIYATVLLIQEDIRATTDAMHRLCLEVAINHRGMTESMAVAHCEVSDE